MPNMILPRVLSLLILMCITRGSILQTNNMITPESHANNQHIIWITDETVYPIMLTVPLNESDDWIKWIKMSENIVLDESLDDMHNYIVKESASSSTLFIVNYNTNTHSELSTYETKTMTDNQHESDTKESNFFTLAYMKAQSIRVKHLNHSMHVKCVADFYVSKFNGVQSKEKEAQLISTIMSQMEKYAVFSMNVNSSPQTSSNLRKQYFEQKPSVDESDETDYVDYSDLPNLDVPKDSFHFDYRNQDYRLG